MAALSGITAVRATSSTNGDLVQYGATISAGQVVYADSTDSNKMKLADNDASAAAATVKGIAITPGISGSYGYVATSGSIILVGTTMAVGTTYYLGATAGEIIPEADIGTNDYVSRLGTAATTTQLDLAITNTGILHA